MYGFQVNAHSGISWSFWSNINIETSDNDLTQIWFDTCFNNVMRRTVYLNRQGAWKMSIGLILFITKSNARYIEL